MAYRYIIINAYSVLMSKTVMAGPSVILHMYLFTYIYHEYYYTNKHYTNDIP